VGKLLCLSFKPIALWFSNRTMPVRIQQLTHIKFLPKTMSQHLNVHLNISIFRLLNTCGTFLEGAFMLEMMSTTFGTLRLHCWRSGSTFQYVNQHIDQQHEETLSCCDRQNSYHTRYWGLCDFYPTLTFVTHCLEVFHYLS